MKALQDLMSLLGRIFNKRNLHDTLGLALIFALFAIEVPRYFVTLPDHDPLVSLGMGVLLAGGAFYCIETWGMLKRRRGGPPKRTWWLAVMIVVQIVAVPAIMTPQMLADQLGEELTAILPGPLLLAWLVLATISPVAVGGMVAFARSLQYSSAELASKTQEAKATSKDAEVTKEPGALVCRFCQERTFATEQGRGAHEAWCPANPDGRRTNHRARVAVGEDE